MACPNGHALPLYFFKPTRAARRTYKENPTPNQVSLENFTAARITQDLEELPKMACQSFVSSTNYLLHRSFNLFDRLK
jgi:hypothetical protein